MKKHLSSKLVPRVVVRCNAWATQGYQANTLLIVGAVGHLLAYLGGNLRDPCTYSGVFLFRSEMWMDIEDVILERESMSVQISKQ